MGPPRLDVLALAGHCTSIWSRQGAELLSTLIRTNVLNDATGRFEKKEARTATLADLKYEGEDMTIFSHAYESTSADNDAEWW